MTKVLRRSHAASDIAMAYNQMMEKKVFWMVFSVLGLAADFLLPLWWGLIATIPILVFSWWVAYRSEWFS